MFGKKTVAVEIHKAENIADIVGEEIEQEMKNIADAMRLPDDILGRHSANVKADIENLSVMIDNLTSTIRILTNELEQATIAHEALNDAFIKMDKSIDPAAIELDLIKKHPAIVDDKGMIKGVKE
jgi:hypothetical protein